MTCFTSSKVNLNQQNDRNDLNKIVEYYCKIRVLKHAYGILTVISEEWCSLACACGH